MRTGSPVPSVPIAELEILLELRPRSDRMPTRGPEFRAKCPRRTAVPHAVRYRPGGSMVSVQVGLDGCKPDLPPTLNKLVGPADLPGRGLSRTLTWIADWSGPVGTDNCGGRGRGLLRTRFRRPHAEPVYMDLCTTGFTGRPCGKGPPKGGYVAAWPTLAR